MVAQHVPHQSPQVAAGQGVVADIGDAGGRQCLSAQPEQAVVRKLQDAIKEELKPGCGYCELRITNLDEALRGLQSSHALIRIHAAVIMGERSLGAAAVAIGTNNTAANEAGVIGGK